MGSKFGCNQIQQTATPTSSRYTPAKLREEGRLAFQNGLSVICRGEYGIYTTSSMLTTSSPAMICSSGYFRMGLTHGGLPEKNRKKLPLQHLPKNAVKEQGQFRTVQKGEFTAVVWMDKKPIYELSTAEDPASIETTVSRKSRSGEIKQVPCPSVIPEYNSNMNGVDHADQLRTEYSTYRTSKKWWAYVFWFLFEVAITNGLVLIKESPNHNRVTKKNRQTTDHD